MCDAVLLAIVAPFAEGGKPLHRRWLGRMGSGRALRFRWVASVVAVMLVAGSCTGSGSPSSSGSEGIPDSQALPNLLQLSGTPDAQAAELAKQVSQGGSGALAAVETAVHQAGIGVVDISLGGKVVVAPASPAQGLNLQAGEVIGMSRYGPGNGDMALTTLTDTLTALLPAPLRIDPSKIPSLMISDIASDASSSVPTVRFWANFIIDLGRDHPASYDLLEHPKPDEVQLDGVQVELILVRLIGDLAASTSSLHLGSSASFDSAAASAAGGISIPKSGIVAAGFDLAQTQGNPCELGTASSVLSGAEKAVKWEFKQLTTYLNEQLYPDTGASAIDQFNAAKQVVNAILSILELVAELATFKMDFELVNGPPLVRTKEKTSDGEKRVVQATLTFDTGNLKWFNCFNFMLNAAGISYKVPKTGPIRNAEVNWGVKSGRGIVKYYPLTPNAHPTKTVTNDDGVTKVGVMGAAQAYKLPETATPEEKQVTISATATIKRADIKNDLMDAASTAVSLGLGGALSKGPKVVGIKGGDVVGGPIGIIKNLAERGMGGLFTWNYTFPVQDWSADFRYEMNIGGLDITGTKCGGPIGDWDMDVNGQVGPITWRGTLIARIAEYSLIGPLGGRLEGTAPSYHADNLFRGRARFSDTDPPMLIISHVQNTEQETVQTPLGPISAVPTGTGTVKIPLTVGKFCD